MQYKMEHGEDKKIDYIQDKQRLNNFCTQNIILPHKYSVFILNCMTNIGIVELIGMEQLIDIYLQLISHRLQIHDEIQRIIESKMDRKNLISPISSNKTSNHIINNQLNTNHNHNIIRNNTNNININNMDTENPSLSNPYFLCQTMMNQPDPFKQELLENEHKEIKNEKEYEQEPEQQQEIENENDNNDNRKSSESPSSISPNFNIKTEIDMEMKHEQQLQRESNKEFVMQINNTKKIKYRRNKELLCGQEQIEMVNEENKENIINPLNIRDNITNSNIACSKNANQSLSDDKEHLNCKGNRKRSIVNSNNNEPSSKRRKLN